MSLRRALLAAFSVWSLTLLACPAADAAFPGPNGKIAFEKNGDIYTINPDGSAMQRLTITTPDREKEPTWSPDGNFIAFTSDYRFTGSGGRDLYVMRSDGTEVRRVTFYGNNRPCVDAPSWSPDGEKLLFSGSCPSSGNSIDIYVVDLDGTGLLNLTNTDSGFPGQVDESSAVWSPDSTKIAYIRGFNNREIWTMNSDGSGQVALMMSTTGVAGLDWSPDSSGLVFSRGDPDCPSCGDTDIWKVNRDGSGLVRLLNATALNARPVWSPDGTRIAFQSCPAQPGALTCQDDFCDPRFSDCSGDIWVMNADGAQATLVTTDPRGARTPDWQPVGPPLPPVPDLPGKIAFVSLRDHTTEQGLTLEDKREIYTMNPDGTRQRGLTYDRKEDHAPAWSQDGTRIAFSHSSGSDNLEVFVMNANGSNPTNLTNLSSANDADPSWSPDGTRIAFWSDRGPGYANGIYVMNADGSGQTQVVESGLYPDWSPDGTRIAYALGGIRTVRQDGTGVMILTTDNNDRLPEWSPDGRKITFAGSNGISTMNADGSGRVDLVPGDEPTWSPDGTKIAFTRLVDPQFNNIDVYVMNADGTGQTNLTNSPSHDTRPDWHHVPVAYPRPKGATPAYFSLATAYKPCTSPDRTHGSPLAFASCSSPQMTSDHLTVGTGDSNGKPARNEGWVRLDVLAGNLATPADEADVRIELFSDDIFTKALTDYTGELRGTLSLRITDKDNTPSPYVSTAGTVQDTTVEFVAGCIPTADPLEGSSCSATTTVDALIPGAIKEGKRSIWQLDRVRVFDGGSDGDADTTADNTLFATQGVFVP